MAEPKEKTPAPDPFLDAIRRESSVTQTDDLDEVREKLKELTKLLNKR